MSGQIIEELRDEGVYSPNQHAAANAMEVMQREIISLKCQLQDAEIAVAKRDDDMMSLRRSLAGGSPMDTAPRNGMPILAWCDHDADPYFMPDDKRLTTYGAHVEGLSQHVPTGWAIVVWGGEYYDSDDGYTPPWWFLHDGDWEMPANPVKWWPLPMEAA